MKKVYIGIGSNLGDPRKNCIEAVDRIKRHSCCEFLKVSPFYRTEPVGVDSQDWYVNAVLYMSTNLTASELMNVLLEIERDMGRVRTGIRWESRIIDLDILLFGDDVIDEENLKVPHPLMHRRRFVMAPITDLDPEMLHPVIGKSMAKILEEIPETEQPVRPMENF